MRLLGEAVPVAAERLGFAGLIPSLRRGRVAARSLEVNAFPFLDLRVVDGVIRVVRANPPARSLLKVRRGQTLAAVGGDVGDKLVETAGRVMRGETEPSALLRLADGSTWRVAAASTPRQNARIQLVMLPSSIGARRLALAMDAAGVGLWTWDVGRNLTTIDERTRTLFGYPADVSANQEMWLSRVHPEDRERIRDLNARCLAGELDWQAEYRIVRTDGAVRWVREATRREGPHTWVGFVLDVTAEIEAREILRRDNEAALRRADDLSDLVESLSDVIIRAAPDSTRLYVNAAYERILGRSRREVVGTRYADMLPPDEAAMLLQRLGSLTPDNRYHRAIREQVLVDGRHVWIEWYESGVFDEAGKLVEIRSVGRDLTDRIVAERRVVDSERRLSMALQGSGRGLWDWSPPSRAVYLCAEAAAILGLPPDACTLHGVPLPESMIHPDDAGVLAASLAPVLAGERDRFEVEHRVRRIDGSEIWLELAGQVVERAANGQPVRLLGLLGDVTPRRAELARIAYLASHDPLTGLVNRAAFEAEANLALARMRQQRTGIAVMMIDLDGFKQINDRFGHPVGDAVLREAAERLRHTLRTRDVVARLGGDEFVALLDSSNRRDEVLGIGHRTLQALSAPLDVEGGTFKVTASIGIAISTTGDTELAELTRSADRALYEAKHAGRNRCRIVEVD